METVQYSEEAIYYFMFLDNMLRGVVLWINFAKNIRLYFILLLILKHMTNYESFLQKPTKYIFSFPLQVMSVEIINVDNGDSSQLTKTVLDIRNCCFRL